MPPDPVLPPPLPGVAAAADAGLPAEVLRLVRLAVSAARADGALSPPERALILARAREAGIEHAVAAEVDSARPLGDIVAGVHDSRQREELYVLAFTIVRADETVTGGERVYLAQLAHHLGLDAATAARLEQQTAAAIDATPDEPDTTPDEAGATGA
jgi:uncharacterized membrane protein YebE (DUF533 family)